MPLTGEAKREASRRAGRKRTARRRAERLRGLVESASESEGGVPSLPILGRIIPTPEWPSDPATAVADWAESQLVVPAGRLQGKPFDIPPW